MPEILPFQALRYDPHQVRLEDVVTQPYDKITPEMQAKYYDKSAHNLVRIILGRHGETDNEVFNVYTRAAEYLHDWRAGGILKQDAEPSMYLYSQTFTIPGTRDLAERRGLTVLGRLHDYAAGVVFRHEQTLAKPKADRLDLLRATRAHFGQIFMLYSDPAAEIENALASADPQLMEINDEYGVLHRVWGISDPAIVALVRGKMRDKKLIIADGHHRYETALTYRNERRQSAMAGPQTGGMPRELGKADVVSQELAPYELAMMTFVNMDSAGLQILPTHRVVHSLASFSMDSLHAGASEFFSVEEADASINAQRATAMLREAAHTGTSLLAVGRDRVFLLSRPKAPASAFGDLSLRQQGLDVVQLHKCLLEGAL